MSLRYSSWEEGFSEFRYFSWERMKLFLRHKENPNDVMLRIIDVFDSLTTNERKKGFAHHCLSIVNTH